MTPKAEATEAKVELWGGLRAGSFPHTGSHQLDEEAHQEVEKTQGKQEFRQDSCPQTQATEHVSSQTK